MSSRLLIVDDEPEVRTVVRRCLEPEHEVLEAEGVESGLATLLAEVPDVLLVDVVMPGGGGLELARRAFDHFPDLAVIVLTGRGNAKDFVEFFRLGVADYVRKPFTVEGLRHSVLRALETRRLRRENARLREEVEPQGPLDAVIGDSAPMKKVRAMIERVAPTEATVLITGASGTGKEVVARSLHAASERRDGPFVPVHCGALSQGLLDSELFGHVKGAFTGADWPRPGRFEEASGGTIFLDEIGTTSEATQVRLLRVLQERRITRVGGGEELSVDVRVVAATNADLRQLVKRGSFREDLLYRLDVVPIRLPCLAERPSDVALLANSFLERQCASMGRRPRTLSQEAVRALARHDWPGNVRELENVIEASLILCGDADVIEPEHLLLGRTSISSTGGADVRLPEGGIDLKHFLSQVESDLIDQAMERTGGSRSKAADLLDIGSSTLSAKLSQ